MISDRSDALPHVLLIVPRGEAVRNFLYSDVLRLLHERARVTVLSVVRDPVLLEPAAPYATILPLEEVPPPRPAALLRVLAENAHDRWLWSAVAQNNWELRDRRAAEEGRRGRRRIVEAVARLLARRPVLEVLTRSEQVLHLHLSDTRALRRRLRELSPDLVFNTSHIHGPAAELPVRAAKAMGIRTCGFIFSWDNLTSRSRIFTPYDDYLVWNEGMRRQLLEIYPHLEPAQVSETGTPQFDFHFQERFQLSREELCKRLEIDPARPYVLYTTGIWNHFYEEHHHVRAVARTLSRLRVPETPQLVVRTYSKGTSEAMHALAREALPNVFFRPGLWDPEWHTPRYEDLAVYSSLLKHCALGINAASTVTLELLLLGKPVINLDFDPPEVSLPYCLGYSRHVRFDHFRPVADSGATMVARSAEELARFLVESLERTAENDERGPARERFLRAFFGATTPGASAGRVAEALLRLAVIQRRR